VLEWDALAEEEEEGGSGLTGCGGNPMRAFVAALIGMARAVGSNTRGRVGSLLPAESFNL